MPKEKDELLESGSAEAWKRIGARRRAGLMVPLFSAYSKTSAGIGDFDDLKLMIDLAAGTGNSILQLLPMNEVGPTFCPYDAVSSFALEPSYIALHLIGEAKRKAIRAKIEKLRKAYPAGAGYVDYALRDAKQELLREIFLEEGAPSAGFKSFVRENAYWLEGFAVYKALKNHNAGRPWYDWPEGCRYRDEDALSIFREEHGKEIEFQKWLQWTAYTQFKAAKDYASSKGVLLKGDLPILISRDSADVWSLSQFFKLDFVAGAPPDMYCAKGQRWGMPTYDWERIAADKYRYLKEKLSYAENFYDILRVDHVVGLFRIWSIPQAEPAENEGLNGSFDPKDENDWNDHGTRILNVMVKSTKMLLCAEDLGVIPKTCPGTLKAFGIPGNDVQRWAKDWKTKHDFLAPDEYRRLSVAMLSTHDTTNWAAWWQSEAGTVDEALFARKCRDRGIDYDAVRGRLFDEARSRHGRLRWLEAVASKDLYIRILGKREEELRDFIELYENSYLEKEKLWKKLGLKGRMREKSDAGIVSAAFGVTLGSRSVFCIETLIDYLYTAGLYRADPYQYRINKPGTVSRTNWSLTLPLPLEELIDHAVAKNIKALVSASGRK